MLLKIKRKQKDFVQAQSNYLKNKSNKIVVLNNNQNIIDKSKIIHVDHHTCHAAYGFYASPIRDHRTIVVTADAFGDFLSGTVSIYN